MMRLADRGEKAAGEGCWRFSLALYARPGVADALVTLQDRAGCDVNLILYGLWLGATQGLVLGAAELTAAKTAIAPIRKAAVAPLRRLRRQLKPAGDTDLQALRRRIAGLEIAAEQLVQQRLTASLGGPTDAAPGGSRVAAADGNLALILGDQSGSSEAGVVRAALAALTRRTG